VPEDFDIGQEFDRMTGEDVGSPTVPEVPTTDSAAPTDNGEQPTGEGVAQPTEGEPAFRWENVPPELEPLAKQFQGDYTRKAQELAEQRRAFEAQQQQVAGFLALQRLTQEDPAQAAALMQQYAAQLQGGQAGQKSETADPYAGLEPASPVEEALLAKVRELETATQQWQQFQQTQQQREEQQRMDAEFAEVEKLAGRTLSDQEKEGLAGFCFSNKIGNVAHGYRLMNYDAEMQRAAQAARNEASTIVSQKALAPGAPSTLTPRAPGNPVKEWKSDREMISDLFDQMVQAG
jgi:hypothetical protein